MIRAYMINDQFHLRCDGARNQAVSKCTTVLRSILDANRKVSH